MNRKVFLYSCGASSALAFLSACSKAYYATNSNDGKNIRLQLSEFVEVKDGASVPRAFVLVKNDRLPFPVAVYRNSESSYSALYLQCTHSGCELRPAPGILQCPCHGSEFSTAGKVLNPPAEKDLLQFPVTVSSDYLTINLPSQ